MKRYNKAIAAAVVAVGLTITWAAGGPVTIEAVGAAWAGVAAVFGIPNFKSAE